MVIEITLKNEFGEFKSIPIEVTEQEYEEIILLSKTFYTSGGYEIQTEQGFIVIPPEIVKKSILCLSIIDYDHTTN